MLAFLHSFSFLVMALLLWMGCGRHESEFYGHRNTVTETQVEKPTRVEELIFIAVQENNLKYIEEQIAKDPRFLNFQSEKNGRTLLMESIVWDRLEIAEALVKKGIDLKLADKNAKLAAEYAKGKPRFERLFVDESQLEEERLKVQDMVSKKNVEAVRKAIQEGFAINSILPNGETILTFSVELKSEALVRMLLQFRTIDVNARNKPGLSPLQLARRAKLARIEKLLLSKGATE